MTTGFFMSTYKNKKGLEFYITKYLSFKNIHIKFVETGFECKATKQQILNGSVKDKISPSVYGVGFVGDGEHKTSKGGKNTEAYKKWIQMLRRCYSKSHSRKNNSYKNCSVCEEWHNFQRFADWFYKNYPNDGVSYDIDKDLLSSGVKKYSPETCSFLTSEENSILAKTGSVNNRYKISKNGVIYEFSNMNKTAKELGIDCGNLSRLLSGKLKSYKGFVKIG